MAVSVPNKSCRTEATWPTKQCPFSSKILLTFLFYPTQPISFTCKPSSFPWTDALPRPATTSDRPSPASTLMETLLLWQPARQMCLELKLLLLTATSQAKMIQIFIAVFMQIAILIQIIFFPPQTPQTRQIQKILNLKSPKNSATIEPGFGRRLSTNRCITTQFSNNDLPIPPNFKCCLALNVRARVRRLALGAADPDQTQVFRGLSDVFSRRLPPPLYRLPPPHAASRFSRFVVVFWPYIDPF